MVVSVLCLAFLTVHWVGLPCMIDTFPAVCDCCILKTFYDAIAHQKKMKMYILVLKVSVVEQINSTGELVSSNM